MGNIEIRDQSNLKRRTQIFNNRNSQDTARSQYRQSLTHRSNNSQYSPIRFSKISQLPKDTPLTERKSNTRHQHQHNNNQTSCSPILNHQTSSNSKTPTHRQHFSKPLRILNISIDQNCQQQNLSSQKTGRIVSNSNKRIQNQRTNYQPFRQLIHQESPQNFPLETKDIIRKVRNFNDFLNEIKRKLKQDKQQTLLRNKSRLEQLNKNHPSQQKLNLKQNKSSPIKQAIQRFPSTHNAIQKSRSIRRIQVALKLQNEKIQLEKYRKLVERQLSKTHSIDNISLCTKNSGQKILTIQYESIFNPKMSPQDNSSASLNKQPSEKTLIHNILGKDIIQHNLEQNLQKLTYDSNPAKTLVSKKDQATLLRSLKLQYKKMFENVLELGKMIEHYQMNQSMAESLVFDDKILIQQGSDLSKKGSVSQRGRQISERTNSINEQKNLLRKQQTQFRQKKIQSRVIQSQLREVEKKLSGKESHVSKGSMSHKMGQLYKSQCESTQMYKNERLIIKLDQEKQYFDREGSRMSKIVILQQDLNQRQETIQIDNELSVINRSNKISQKNSQASRQGSREIMQDSQGRQDSQGSRAIKQESKSHKQEDQKKKQIGQQISFAGQSQESTFRQIQSLNGSASNDRENRGGGSMEKISRIESLFDKLNDLQEEYQETDRKVRQAIGEDDSHSQLNDSSY